MNSDIYACPASSSAVWHGHAPAIFLQLICVSAHAFSAIIRDIPSRKLSGKVLIQSERLLSVGRLTSLDLGTLCLHCRALESRCEISIGCCPFSRELGAEVANKQHLRRPNGLPPSCSADDYSSRGVSEEGFSRQTAAKWVRRNREQGLSGLRDRNSRPHSSPRGTSQERVIEIEGLRRERWTG